jgi:TPR repeat protein
VDDAAAVGCFEPAVAQGYAEAQCWLADMLADGRAGSGRRVDAERAQELYRAAAEQGMAEAQYLLALQLAANAKRKPTDAEDQEYAEHEASGESHGSGAGHGHGHGHDPHLDAAHGLGGPACDHELAEAASWFVKAAEQGHGKAQNRAAWAYATGAGVTKNHAEALKWWRLAADQGESLGMLLASYRLPSAPGFEIEVVLKAATGAGQPVQWHI